MCFTVKIRRVWCGVHTSCHTIVYCVYCVRCGGFCVLWCLLCVCSVGLRFVVLHCILLCVLCALCALFCLVLCVVFLLYLVFCLVLCYLCIALCVLCSVFCLVFSRVLCSVLCCLSVACNVQCAVFNAILSEVGAGQFCRTRENARGRLGRPGRRGRPGRQGLSLRRTAVHCAQCFRCIESQEPAVLEHEPAFLQLIFCLVNSCQSCFPWAPIGVLLRSAQPAVLEVTLRSSRYVPAPAMKVPSFVPFSSSPVRFPSPAPLVDLSLSSCPAPEQLPLSRLAQRNTFGTIGIS